MATELALQPTSSDGLAPAKRRARGRVRRLASTVLPPLAVLAVFVGIWYLVSYVVLAPSRRFLLPPPQRVLQVGFFTRANLVQELQGLAVTTRVAAIGLAMAIGIGMVVAISMSQAAWIERSLYPYAVILQTIPILALVPLFGFWFGFGLFSRVVVCTMIALFPIIANTLFGLKSIDPGLRDLFRMQHTNRFVRLVKLDFPSAVPAVFAGFRISAGLAVIGAIVGDFFFRQGTTGIGILMSLYTSRLQAEQLFAAIILSSGLGIVAFWLFGILGYLVGRRYDRSAL
jgi:NitT/TauT family transport system permease protein